MADKSYPTDLKDTEWKLLEPLLVRNSGRRGKRKHDLRRIVDGCFLRSAWRDFLAYDASRPAGLG